MNVNCIICSDLLNPADAIYTTPCGHLFHHVCLIQWIERSKTCPQCRNKTTEKIIHRVYFNLTNTDSTSENVGTLQSKLDNLQFEINLKERDFKAHMEKYESIRANNAGLRSEIKELEDKSKTSESTIHALKEQISYFKHKGKQCKRLYEEVARLKEKLKDLENVQLVLDGSRDEVKDMLRQNRDPQSLSILVASLKRTLIETDRKYKQISSDLKHTQNSISCYRKEITEVQLENNKLKNDIESHKYCPKECQSLKRKISDLEVKSSLSHEPRLPKIRILDDSASMSKSMLNDSRTALNETFTVSDRIKQIKESDSPYLPIKSSNVGLSPLLKSRYTTLKSSSEKGAKTFNILKQSPKVDFKMPTKEFSYDGLGGHSKQDNFPSPKSLNKFKFKPFAASGKLKKSVPNVKTKQFFLNHK